ncbi:MAG: enoyl-CoA hydratase-related protein [Dehalococcoidales bacterium]|nr:enoyl-CoA hydratase-related protein [Dehalococcoidales bacterium]
MDYEGLTLEKADGIATLTFNRPEKLNAFTDAIARGMEELLPQLSLDDDVKALIITGAGRGFCAGLDANDLARLRRKPLDELYHLLKDLTLTLDNFTKPMIAAINGVTAGAGLAIAIFCDFRIAVPEAKFFAGYNRMAITPDIGMTYNLPRIVGPTKATEIMIIGEPLTATEALQIGLLNRIVPAADLMQTARELAGKIARGPTVSINLTRQALKKSRENNITQQIDVEFATMATCVKTADHEEGLNAFLEKRPPEFQGK